MPVDQPGLKADLLASFDKPPADIDESTDDISQAIKDNVTDVVGVPPGTVGHVSFWDTVTTLSGDSNLFWDNLNKWLGVGITPTRILDVRATTGIPFRVSGGDANGLGISLKHDGGGTGNEFEIYTLDDSHPWGEGLLIYDRPATAARLFINGSGYVGINNVNPGYRFDVNEDRANSYVANFFNDGDNGNRWGIKVQAGTYDGTGTCVFFEAYDGDGNYTGILYTINGVFQLADTSDARLKIDIAPTKVIGLNIIKALPLKEFRYKKHGPEGYLHKIGFIAQDCETVYPDMVSEGDEEHNKPKGTSKSQLVPVLVKAIQEQQEMIEQLQSRVTALE